MNNTPLEDFGLTEWDWQAINEAQMGTPPNASEWEVYLRKLNEEPAYRETGY